MDALDTDRRGDLASMAGFGLRAEGRSGFGVFFVLSGAGDRSLEWVLGVRGVLGVGGSLLTKWQGRDTFFFSAVDGSIDRRVGTGMRLGELGSPCKLCKLVRRE